MVAQDVFQVPIGHVVVAHVTKVDKIPEKDQKKRLRPRTPSRSPKRKDMQEPGRKVFGPRPPLPVSKPGRQRTYYTGGRKQMQFAEDGKL